MEFLDSEADRDTVLESLQELAKNVDEVCKEVGLLKEAVKQLENEIASLVASWVV